MKLNQPLLTDLYQMTMAQGYWEQGQLDTQACFYMYFRDYPFKGGYAVACGMAQLAELVEGYGFSDDDLDYLSSIPAPGGGALFKQEFLKFLQSEPLRVDIDAVWEGTTVFPHEPLVRVVGPIWQCQLIETPLLNCVSFETLVATKAARISLVAGAPVAEFGLRRAQGAAGGAWASRAAVVGGCASTSNILAGKLFDIPVSGTHAHSWVMSFPDELTAFRAYAESFPTNCVLLVDTYNIEQGIRNAITVGLEMRQRGQRLMGIRIDSGDLAWYAKRARAMLDEAGLTDCGVVLSNDLDEFTIKSIRDQGAQVGSWGVGTKLATCFDQPTLGGVYKLSATKKPGGQWVDHLKISGTSVKLTIPGVLDVRRYVDSDGQLAGDMIFDTNVKPPSKDVIVDPFDDLRRKDLSGCGFETLLKPLARAGEVVLKPEQRNAMVAQQRTREGLAQLDESQKRLHNPHTYPVGLEKALWKRRHDLYAKLRGYDE
ncbi:MAG: nicotinate phosphoribosyltransferase [Coriobacteriia bacterium]|nr:nicotinate phosphoribosyltransferase [Coriobacteriia bacterium]